MKRYALLIPAVFFTCIVYSQNLGLTTQAGLKIVNYTARDQKIYQVLSDIPLFSFQVDGKIHNLGDASVQLKDTTFKFSFEDQITGEIFIEKQFHKGWKCRVIIQNNTGDTVDIENVVPFCETTGHIYLTSTGPWALARAKIFRPGLGPVGVILPDNAWEMGYGAIPINENLSVCAMARRTKSDRAEWRRYRTIVYPGGNVEYTIWADEYSGEWQNGLKLMFQDRYLYDLDSFNDSLYRRSDLQWIRHDYLIGLQFAWNQEYYDWQKQDYTVGSFLERGMKIFGGYDVIGLWPTWPRLGVDQRNQWDLFSDMPGGLNRLKSYSQQWKLKGTKFFICYNPWDESTRTENPYAGMAMLIEATDADGVVLDCHGASSIALQKAADSIKPGVVMYSEGMAVVQDMPGIVAGRVHDAIYLPPPLNLNKLIRPDFAIFRVCQVHDGRIKREASVALFNGYGTELNTFAPGQFDNMEEDLLYLGMTTRILRENTSNFLSWQWTPLLPTTADSIWVNKWPLEGKTVYTVFSLVPGGFKGPLFEEAPIAGFHLVSLWHHEELDWIEKDSTHYVPVKTSSFNSYDLDTRAEGSIDCIALLPELIKAELSNGILSITASNGDEIRVWAGNPAYQNNRYVKLEPGTHELNLIESFGNYEGKFVIQLFKNNELADEKIVFLEPGSPRLIGKTTKTPVTVKTPDGMILIPSGSFSFFAENTDQFIPYPDSKEPASISVSSYFIDKYPVTNKQFDDFMKATAYFPKDTVNFLKHWLKGKIPAGFENHPVVYISLEDARAYATWAGKRLPTEVEWQYAAQGPEGLIWPWGNDFDSTRCNNASGKTSPVNDFPRGKSPFGVMDLSGNIWQLTADVYNNGTYYFVIMKGGSFYKPTSSWWYVKGGPQPNTWHQQLLLVAPSFDRNATVGFRCVKDITLKTCTLLFLNETGNFENDKEFVALSDFLKTLNFSKFNILSANSLIKHPKLFEETGIIWVYKNDTLPLKSALSKKLSSSLTNFVENGGKLILANQAFMLIPLVQPDEKLPETRIKQSIDEGYGRQLGYHSFRAHPLFDGMNGGAYVLKPLHDTVVLQTGYFGDNKPAVGRVIGVDWDYIFLREESKLIVEYELGKGKILGIGGYLLYEMPNRNRIHLETFTNNIFSYLSGDTAHSKRFYWNYGISGAIETPPFRINQPIPHPGSEKLPGLEPALSIKPGRSSGNYWDLAGERLLLMGEDSGGIREIWAHPVMSLRDYEVRFALKEGDSLKKIDLLRPEIEILPSAYIRNYDLTAGRLGESITVSPREPFAVVHYDYEGPAPVNFDISFRALFRLMWPYSEKVLGNLLYSWNEDLQAFIASDQSGDFVTIIGVNGQRDGISCSTSNSSGFEMPSQIVSFQLKLPGPGSFDVIIASSADGFDKTLKAYLKALSDPAAVFLESQAYADSILQNSLMFESPDKGFNDGYRWALLATDRFQVYTPGLGSSLVAGYATSDKGWGGEHAVSGRPGYGWYFGRDGVWSAFALLHYGDFEKVRLMMETFQRFQDLNGKIFHELSTSGIAHYDAADATPLYIILAGRYLRHSGDSAFIRTCWPFIKKAIDFCYSTDTDGDLLIENTNVGHGWEEGGHLFGSHTTLYLASCWAEALDEASYLAKSLGLDDDEQKYHQDALKVKTDINRDFWNPQNNYYYHGLMPDGTYMQDVSITACIPLLFNQSDHDKAQKVLPVIAANGFTSDWGCRIVEEGSPHFNPGGYHTGSVWPLFTGWAALAEFGYNNYLQGFSHMMSNIMVYQYWGLGFIEEVLNGEIFQPFGVCHHQCWSETMALQPAIEGMLGYKPDALDHSISLKPWFPADWDSVEVTGIRLEEEKISMEVRRRGGMEAGKQGSGATEKTVRLYDSKNSGFVNIYSFNKSDTSRLDVHFQPVFPPGSVIQNIRVNGIPAKDPGIREYEQGWVIPEFGFWLDSNAIVEISWEGGITALPVISHPQPGDRSEGMRIINTSYSEGEYSVTVEGLQAGQYELKVWAADPGKYKVKGAEITGITGNIITLSIGLPESETKYAAKNIVLLPELSNQ